MQRQVDDVELTVTYFNALLSLAFKYFQVDGVTLTKRTLFTIYILF